MINVVSVSGYAVLKRAVSRNPNLLFAHLFLAINYSELDRAEEAQAAAATVLRLNPNFSVEVWQKKVALHIDPTVTERNAAALRKAGLE